MAQLFCVCLLRLIKCHNLTYFWLFFEYLCSQIGHVFPILIISNQNASETHFLVGVFVSSLLLMVLMKPFFLIYYHEFTSQCTVWEILKVFFLWIVFGCHHVRLHNSSPIVGCFDISLFQLVSKEVASISACLFLLGLYFYRSCLFSVDLGLYEFWGFRIDGMLLFGYLSDPATAMASVTIGQILRQTLLFLVYGAIMFYTYYRISFCLYQNRKNIVFLLF